MNEVQLVVVMLLFCAVMFWKCHQLMNKSKHKHKIISLLNNHNIMGLNIPFKSASIKYRRLQHRYHAIHGEFEIDISKVGIMTSEDHIGVVMNQELMENIHRTFNEIVIKYQGKEIYRQGE